MKHIAVPLFGMLIFLSCNSKTGETAATTNATDTISSTSTYAAAVDPAPLPPMPACYQLINGQDTMMLRLRSMNEDGEITGDLNNRTKAKESNNGTFFGRLAGDTLVANYSFLQKGKRKVKEVAFLRRGENWIEGSGPSAEQGGIRRFTDLNSLEFSGGVYQKATCQ